MWFHIEKVVGENLEQVFDLEFDDFSQFYIKSKHMQHNEWGQHQGDKWEHFSTTLEIFDVLR